MVFLVSVSTQVFPKSSFISLLLLLFFFQHEKFSAEIYIYIYYLHVYFSIKAIKIQ